VTGVRRSRVGGKESAMIDASRRRRPFVARIGFIV
jgi:hypothetical protein